MLFASLTASLGLSLGLEDGQVPTVSSRHQEAETV